MFSWKQRQEMVGTSAWEIVTKNGLDLDETDRSSFMQHCFDTAANVYTDGLSDSDWLAAVTGRLQSGNIEVC